MSYIDDVFGPLGTLSRMLPGYEPRPEQEQLARAVDAAFAGGRHLVAEAPCGVGKSLAYGVPAVWHAVHRGMRVVIATANIALQEQLVTKDLPFLAGVLPWSFNYALVKGRSNYLCCDQWLIETEKSRFKNRRNKVELAQYRSILKWAKETHTGDVSELKFAPPPGMWRLFSVGGDECKGGDCRHHDDCFAEKAHEGLAGAHLIVTNYHLLFAHLQVRAKTQKDLILPRFDLAVCDEGHKAAEIARDFFGFRMVEASVRFASRALSDLQLPDMYQELSDEASRFFHELGKAYRSSSYRIRFRQPPEIRWQPFHDILMDAHREMLAGAVGVEDRDRQASLRKAAAAATNMAGNLSSAMTLADGNFVYFVEESSNGSLALMGKPIQVAPMLGAELFDRTSSVVATSATLAVNGRFGHITSELGVPDYDGLVVGSPFDFAKQALLVVPEGMPPASDPSFHDAVADAVVEIIGLSEGRVLGLFTSYKSLEKAHAKAVALGRYRIMRQGEQPRTALVEEFRKDVSSVLLGTESFWAGVDIPGESLSCVVIDRLPFQSPGDPVLDAISERNPNWFMEHSLPKAVIALKQGFGRLIRSTKDYGVVVLLDRRVVTKPYGWQFLASLPQTMRSKKLSSVKVFLDRHAQQLDR